MNEKEFSIKAQQLGINNDSIIVIYDRWGIYSSPRAWWMFKYMGHENVHILNGGLPEWETKGLPTVTSHIQTKEKGNFAARSQPKWFANKDYVLAQINEETTKIIDARGAARFNGTAPEPRPGVRSGHIPTSSNLPFENVLDGIYMKSKNDLTTVLHNHTDQDGLNIFSCGSGITASILALAAYEADISNIAVFDGSWSEWGSDPNLPVEL